MKSSILLLIAKIVFIKQIFFFAKSIKLEKSLNDTLLIKSNNHINSNVIEKIKELNGKVTYYEDDNLLVS